MTTGSSSISGGLGKDAFLQLMVAQMKNQDPLQPTSNTQFVAQLAQFSALEQMQNVAQEDSTISATLSSLLQLSQLGFEHQLLGTSVTVTGSNGQAVQGTVSSISFQNGSPQLVINGSTYPLSALQQMGG